MRKIRIGIVEDEKRITDELIYSISTFFETKNVEISINSFSNAEDFLKTNSTNYDLILMDIQLPGMNGMDAISKIRETNKLVLVIFVSSMAQYVIKGYEVNAFDFVLKPVSYYNLTLKLNRVLESLNKNRTDTIVIKNKTSVFQLDAMEITYIEVINHSLVFHTVNNEYTSSGTLKKIEEQLKDLPFVLCNQCYLVNLKYVSEIKYTMAVVNGKELQISRSKHKMLIHELNKYLSNNGNLYV